MADSQHTQNIQINKDIGENKKCVFYLVDKKKSKQTLGQPNTTLTFCSFFFFRKLQEVQLYYNFQKHLFENGTNI